jgi:hypothetical protein
VLTSRMPSITLLQSLSNSTLVKQQSIANFIVRYKALASAVEGSWIPGVFQVAEASIWPSSSRNIAPSPQLPLIERLASQFALILPALGFRHFEFRCVLLRCWICVCPRDLVELEVFF